MSKKPMVIFISKCEGPQSWEHLDQMDKSGGIKAMQHSPKSPAPDLVFLILVRKIFAQIGVAKIFFTNNFFYLWKHFKHIAGCIGSVSQTGRDFYRAWGRPIHQNIGGLMHNWTATVVWETFACKIFRLLIFRVV